jgi:hypothetical protein
MADVPTDSGSELVPEPGAAGPPHKQRRMLKAHVGQGSGGAHAGEACDDVGKSVAAIGMRALEATRAASRVLTQTAATD